MEALPSEFTSIIERLEHLKKMPILDDVNVFDYETAVWKFKVVAKSTIWKESSQMVVERIKKLVGEFYKENYKRYSLITNHIEFEEPREILHKGKNKDGDYFIITPKGKIRKNKITNDEDRKKWYSNIIPELKAYESLSQENLGSRPLIEKNIAEELSKFETKNLGPLFDDKGESRNNFIRLLSDPFLLDYEIEVMKIFFGTPLKTVAIDLNKLIKKYKLPFATPAVLIEFGCFYHLHKGMETKVTPPNFRSVLSKTKNSK
jgi:hypothetical protein